MKADLAYLSYKTSRVCQACFEILSTGFCNLFLLFMEINSASFRAIVSMILRGGTVRDDKTDIYIGHTLKLLLLPMFAN